VAWCIVEQVHHGRPSMLGAATGAVAGLVAITPASGFVGPAGALAIGAAAGIGCYWGATWLKRAGGYDDSLDAFGVHAVGGIIGALLTGVFAVKAIGGTAGLLEGNLHQIITQAYGVACTLVYDAIATFVILKAIDAVIGLRVDADTEREGLDINLHGETVP
jgi:Amt family ammonium transporter